MNLAFDELKEIFRQRFGKSPNYRSRAPGRVNLIGEHTDYNQGFVLPAALKYEVRVVASPRPDEKVRLHSVNFQQEDEFSLNSLKKNPRLPWSSYVRGVLDEILKAGFAVKGFEAVISGDVPLGSGLSSSAALEVAAASILREMFGLSIGKIEIAKLCQRAENNFVGVNCGIMDQFVSVLGEEDRALLIDCRDLSYRAVPLHLGDHLLVIADSRAPRDLASSAYNEHRAECERGVEILSKKDPSIFSLRDASLELLSSCIRDIPEKIGRRLRHVITENERTLESARLLSEGDLYSFGTIMKESHRSLKEDYEVSSFYLDTLVEAALSGEDCLGSRLTGAGFGGCTVNLVRKDSLDIFKERVESLYREKTGKIPVFYLSQASAGAEASFFYAS